MKEKLLLIDSLDKIFKALRLASLLVLLLLVLLFSFSFSAQAMSTEDLFMVPVVKSNGVGAVIYQPQSGAGLTGSNLNTNKNAVGLQNSYTPIMPNFPPSGTWQPPTYNAFAKGSDQGEILAGNEQSTSPVEVNLVVSNNMPGSVNGNFGTLATTFTFTANISGLDSNNQGLEFRFDFNNDGKPDSYFSKIDKITHRYEQPGEYQIGVEVLDQNGKIARASTSVTVVANDAPYAQFTASEITAAAGTIIYFDSSSSTDNQYQSGQLKYRFDWNGDGIFDTGLESKTAWYHLFNQPGKFNVVMEAVDPEGLSSKAHLNLVIEDNSAPTASFVVLPVSNNLYLLDASSSTDDHTELNKLKFRWDYNYTGPNDIVFDTGFSNSPKQMASFKFGGKRKIRLEVMDEGGLVSQSVLSLDIPWGWSSLNLSQPF